VLTQHEQDGDAPLGRPPGHGRAGGAPGRVGEQGALPASRLADQHQNRALAAVKDLAERVPQGGLSGLARLIRLIRLVTVMLPRRPADQRDVDEDVGDLRDVIAAGREITCVDVRQGIKDPPPVPVPVTKNGRCPHNLSPRSRGHSPP
jgi:hypothetical protein